MPTDGDDPSLSECQHCGATREGHSYLLLYGDWDPGRDGFSRPPVTEPICQSCWLERHGRTMGAHYEVDDPQTLWDVLRAADGALVADLKCMFVGGRPFVRVVDGDLQGLGSTMQRVDEETLRVRAKHLDVDREWFFDVLGADEDSERERPRIAIIRPVEETPFGDVRERGGDSHKLTRWAADDE